MFMNILIQVGLLAVGFVCLVKGADVELQV